ncbi:MAG: 2-C-methyl-D-erythritol 4-phosphate cytidylyltransferase [Clostridiales bacterium]|nr:2-C-methyl-D-erythritol 4-phosphate cytidylyltransferase [Clostridiales bacterium]
MKLFDRLKKEKRHPYCAAVIAAAGSSMRMGGENKLFMELDEMPVLLRTLQAVDDAGSVDEIVVAARSDMLLPVADLCSKAGLSKPVRVIEGGSSRLLSVMAAVMEVSPETEFVAVHDGARPLVTPSLFDAVVEMAVKTNAAAPAVPVKDTVKEADETGKVCATPDRSHLYAVQTPQVFQRDLLKAALQSAMELNIPVTDDCAAVERLGKEVYLTEGDEENIKITTPLDLDLAEAILKRRENA